MHSTSFTTYALILGRLCALSIGLLVLSVACFAQTQQQPDLNVYTIVETQPEFPGGINALLSYLNATIHYPHEAQEAKIKGRVFVSFIVETDGSLSDIQVLKGLGYGCDEEAMRVVKAMPCWIPGSQSGRLIRVKYNLPIAFGTDFPKRKGH